MIIRTTPRQGPSRTNVWASGVQITGLHPGGTPDMRIDVVDGYVNGAEPSGYTIVDSYTVTLGPTITAALMLAYPQWFSDTETTLDDLILQYGGEVGSALLSAAEAMACTATLTAAATVERSASAAIAGAGSATANGTVV